MTKENKPLNVLKEFDCTSMVPKSVIKIVGVAIEYDGVVYSLSAPYRHHDVIKSIIQGQNIKQVGSNGQGFMTDKGEFVDRIQAAKIALECGQVEKLIAPPRLYSEDLW